MEPRISISDLFEKWELYVYAKHRTISEGYEGPKKNRFTDIGIVCS